MQYAMIASAVAIMAFAARADRRSEARWGAITLIVCLVCDYLIPWPAVGIGIGFVISFAAMFAMNIIAPRPPV